MTRRKLEIVTSRLALEFLSSILSLSRPSDRVSQLEFLNTPTTFVSNLAGSEYISISNGSLLQRGLVGTRWTTLSGLVRCSVEAKAWLEGEATDEVGKFRRVLAQQVGEMVGMINQRLGLNAEMNEFNRTVFLIAAHQDHLRFMSATFSTEYLDYLRTSIEPPSVFLSIQQSRDYVLSDIDDRIEAAASILAMVEFLDDGLNAGTVAS
ncbi:MAG: hypothetical protein M1840_003063 [Geoglossum simile]|nr:MAG: hypothetical protein M1840_003063 [Geoglossum simile]